MKIYSLAEKILSKEEFKLADKIFYLINKKQMHIAWSLIENILPKFWTEENGLRTLWPDDVFRPLYYLEDPNVWVENPRHTIGLMGQHLEGLLGLLEYLSGYQTTSPFGSKVKQLKIHGELSEDLSLKLSTFNQINIRVKHMGADKLLPNRLNERTFSLNEVILSFLVMRRISMDLFSLLREKGKPLQEDWKNFDPEWLQWKCKDHLAVISQRQYYPPTEWRKNYVQFK